MVDNKYIGVQGLEELINLTKNSLAKKADTLQFDVMPDPVKYIGKVVQYVGISDSSYTRSHFYYSDGTRWNEENISGEQATQEIDTALSSVSTNPVQNKVVYAAIQDVLAQVVNLYHFKGSCLTAGLPSEGNAVGDTWNLEDDSSYGPAGTSVAWTGTEWVALSGGMNYMRGLHDPDWVNSEYVNFNLIAGNSIITTYTCPKRGIIIGSYTTSASDDGSEPFVRVTDSSSDDLTNGILEIYGSPTSCNFNFPVNKGDKVTFYTILKDGSPSLGRWTTRFVPYKVQ